jgi:hypothetical protein
VLAAWIAAAAGCHAPPIVVDAGAPGDPALSATEDLWLGDDPAPILPAGSRVAVLECSVEFVTMKQVTPGRRQAMLGGPFTPLSALVELSGVFRKRVSYPSDVLGHLPNEVYESLVDMLERRGLAVVDPHLVVTTRTYGRLDGSATDKSSAFRLFDPRGSDVGRTNAFEVYPASPLRVLDVDSRTMTTAADRAILAELGADATIRLRLRVGVFHGRASVERNSVLTVGTADGLHRLTSSRSFVSAPLLASPDGYELVAGRAYDVHWPAYRQLVLASLPAYLEPALP